MNIERTDFDIIHKIVLRADVIAERLGYSLDRLTLTIDLMKADEHIPIDYVALADADEGNFAHDIFGIMKHMNRETGKLGDCFVPRFAKAETA